MKFIKRIGRLILFITVVLAASISAESKNEKEPLSARRVFLHLAPSITELLPKSQQLDLLDYYDANSKGIVFNAKRGLSVLDTLTNDFMELYVTPSSTLQIKVFKNKNGNDVAMTIYTVGNEGEAQDSELAFYDADMNKVDARKHFEEPKLKDFFEIPKGSLTSMKEIEQLIPFYTVAYTAAPSDNEVKATLTIKELMNIEDMRLIELFIKPEVTMVWNGKKLVKK